MTVTVSLASAIHCGHNVPGVQLAVTWLLIVVVPAFIAVYLVTREETQLARSTGPTALLEIAAQDWPLFRTETFLLMVTVKLWPTASMTDRGAYWVARTTCDPEPPDPVDLLGVDGGGSRLGAVVGCDDAVVPVAKTPPDRPARSDALPL